MRLELSQISRGLHEQPDLSMNLGFVAQVANLLFRRLAVGGVLATGRICGLPIRGTADWQSALRQPRSSSQGAMLESRRLFAKKAEAPHIVSDMD